MSDFLLLDSISSPDDLKKLTPDEITELASEIRSFLVDSVTTTGGHLSSNLGVVELTIALHRVFDCPRDNIVWDVGHQSYVHKLLTGRREEFGTLRQPGGLSGFTRRSESEYDCFGAGHSSTSVSAALGLAEAERLRGSGAFTVAVVGDGAFTGGMIHEALNNCEDKKGLNLVIILNENEMSISKNTGRFAEKLAKIRSTPSYFRTKAATKRFLGRIPLIGKPLFRFIVGVKRTLKNLFYGSNYFEDLGLFYIGPVDGNDERKLESVLSEAKKYGENAVIHIKTVKGKGYVPAEKTPSAYHSVSPGGKPRINGFSERFAGKLTELAGKDEKICAITAAMTAGTGLGVFAERFPDRFFDVGIAEEHAVTFAAGLAAGGMKPAAAVYSTFLQRAYDNLLHDVALQKLPVVIGVDRAGLSTSDGATHHGIFDVSFLSSIPGMTVFAPATYAALDASVAAAFASGGPAAVRYPAGVEDPAVVGAFYPEGSAGLRGVRFYRVDEGTAVVIVCHGRIASAALEAADILEKKGVRTGVALCEIIKPYEIAASILADNLPLSVEKLVFAEEEIRAGGFGMNLSDSLDRFLPDRSFVKIILASDDEFPVPEKGQTVFEAAGVDAGAIAKAGLQGAVDGGQ